MRFNSVIAAFLFILLTSSIALVTFLQTNSFGRLLTKVATDLTIKKTAMAVSIKSIKFSVFPPGLEFNRVTVNKKISDVEEFSAEFGKLGFYVSLIELEEKRLTFGEIRISDSTIDYTFPEKNEPLTEIDSKIIDQVFDITEHAPVRVDSLLVENTKVFANHDIAEVRRLKVFKKNKNFMTRFHIANLKPVADMPFALDEIWGDVEIGKKDIWIQRLKLQHDVHAISIKGKVSNYPKLLLAEVNINGEAQTHLKNLHDSVSIPEILKFYQGVAKIDFEANLKQKKINGKASVKVNDFRTSVAFGDALDADLSFVDNRLNITKANFLYNEQKVRLLRPVEIADFDNSRFVREPFWAAAENVDLNNAIRILGPDFSIIKGRLTGEISIRHEKGNFYFIPKDGFIINDLGLVVGEDKGKPVKIVMASQARVRNTNISVIDGEFRLKTNVDLPNSKLSAEGFVNKNQVKFHIPNSPVDLLDFGNIANLDVKGRGLLGMTVSGSPKNAVINLKGDLKGFGILGYELDETKEDMSIHLKDSEVVIHQMDSRVGITDMKGKGFVNYGNSDIFLSIKTGRVSYPDLTRILDPLFSKMDFLPEDLDFNSVITTEIKGKTNLKELKVKSQVNYTDLNAYGENIPSGSLDIGFEKEVVTISNFKGAKGEGNVEGYFSVVMPTKRLKTNFSWQNIAISTFNISKRVNLNFNGSITGGFIGEGTTSDYVVKMDSKITNSEAQSYSFKDSDIHLDIMPRRVKGVASLLGGIIDSEFDLSLEKSHTSKLKINVDAPDIKPFAVAFLGQHLDAEEFSGIFKGRLDSRFKPDFTYLDLRASLDRMQLQHKDFNVDYTSSGPEFQVVDSVVKKWNLNIKEQDLFLVTNGRGTFGKNVSLVHEVHFNSKIVDLILSQVLSAEGFIRNIVKVDSAGSDYVFSGSSKANGLNLSIDGLPFPINNLSYGIELLKNRLIIQEMKTSLDTGELVMKGDMFFDGGAPDINIKYFFDKAEVPILGKSSINLSGEGIILGNELPYNLSGQLVINKGQIVNEINDFSSKTSGLDQIRFLPKTQESQIDKLINLAVNVKTENPVRITNSLMDVSLRGEVALSGHPSRPRADGRLLAPANSSRVFFKSNEYLLTNVDLNFSSKKDIANPDFDIHALTYISNYKITAKAYGDLERFSFDLTSDPSLTRNSILSLIAFGYTDELQSSIRPEDRSSLTQVGVGSFVFDRFKITDILNKQFGLQLNLGTVIEQSRRDSLISGRGGGGDDVLGRTRTATKVELKKRLDEALSLSVSSTMGGNIGQRQSMNLNYSLTKKVQLEGIYELRTNVDGEEDIIDNSIGGDVKLRWTFR